MDTGAPSHARRLTSRETSEATAGTAGQWPGYRPEHAGTQDTGATAKTPPGQRRNTNNATAGTPFDQAGTPIGTPLGPNREPQKDTTMHKAPSPPPI